jgi:hypothetical protein
MRKKSNKKNIRNQYERNRHLQKLRKADSEPTSDEGIDFDESDDISKELEPDQQQVKPLSSDILFIRHIKKYAFQYIFSLIGTVLFYLAFTLSTNVSVNTNKIDNNSNTINNLNNNMNEIRKITSEQETKIRVNEINLENLEEDISDVESKLDSNQE